MEKMGNSAAAELIARFRSKLRTANTIDDVRMIEGHGGGAYVGMARPGE
jgi:hypothetical protein